MVTVEVCANSVQSAIEAQKGGAVRVELCGNLCDGGTTPAKSQIELTRKHIEIDLNVIIRPRGGDFLYDNFDFESMKSDITMCGELNCDGVVIGMLDENGHVDIEKNGVLVQLAKQYGMSVTFHRAFDRVCDIYSALEDVISLGCDRILTSGGHQTAFDGRNILKELVNLAADRIVIMAGAGVKESNVRELVHSTGVKEVHGTFQTLRKGGMKYNNPNFPDNYNNSGYSEYSFLVSDSDRIKEIVKSANL
ncbi:copper homeostasis protein [Dysgonomonas alginatilytica]|uniref:PF03932 family protein CutC n=1 Tax=Dysgonomonas alginatilytica TaxID=1605892 RepID=A0A2V3PLP3_9BACT|nr:copper homeostasis protein CutC [Dysgonomonas alginatilytica]PXV62213.1 copper homeostasis protein [Dysgonomonas alginatilytica]